MDATSGTPEMDRIPGSQFIGPATPPPGIGGSIRLINIYISSMENIMPEHNACAAMTATLINFIGVNFMKKVIIIILYSGFSCTQDFLKRFLKEIEFIAPAVPQDIPFTTEKIMR